jgi:hypothetical protein
LTVAKKTVEKHFIHWHQLYEQQKQKKATSEEMPFILERYINRWQQWAVAGLPGINIALHWDRGYIRRTPIRAMTIDRCPGTSANQNTAP